MTTGFGHCSTRRSSGRRSGGVLELAPRQALQFGDVGARDERAPGAQDHHRGDAGVRLGGVERGHQALAHGGAEGVHRRVVHVHDEHAAVVLDRTRAGRSWIVARETCQTVYRYRRLSDLAIYDLQFSSAGSHAPTARKSPSSARAPRA